MGMCVRTSHHVYTCVLNQLPRMVIENDLKSGITVICDRYAFSGIAFSAVKPGLSYEWCKAPDISLPAPDLVLFLEVHPDVARERGGYGEERYEKEAYRLAYEKCLGRLNRIPRNPLTPYRGETSTPLIAWPLSRTQYGL